MMSDLITRKKAVEDLKLVEKAANLIAKCIEEECDIKTNADRIRSMNDEELAHFFASIFEQESRCPEDAWDRCTYPDNECQDCWLYWLRKEVKE